MGVDAKLEDEKASAVMKGRAERRKRALLRAMMNNDDESRDVPKIRAREGPLYLSSPNFLVAGIVVTVHRSVPCYSIWKVDRGRSGRSLVIRKYHICCERWPAFKGQRPRTRVRQWASHYACAMSLDTGDVA